MGQNSLKEEALPTGMIPGSVKINHLQKSIHTMKQNEVKVVNNENGDDQPDPSGPQNFGRMNDQMRKARSHHGIRKNPVEENEREKRMAS